ncbi:trehalose-phosphatase [Marinobacter orientalis]|uniref:Trehalose 6-phosphate phosphatase n=1 Tax=Marinobacter orientalis TaxID=1928859 RepID=A0A7Y0WSK9_9GAMM|nr:trehalose-phosphatase [Marinobacter orientalis]NMT63896.1 trehalose-phosphatase [Marinobacter orientalis]TGX49996.1 trehalose-phosphatase [Marinobacter orientalis]
MSTNRRTHPFRAVIFDMDGVLTRTADLHMQAWKQIFDDYLSRQNNQQPFSRTDYLAHVDGKPRYQGVEDFLHSRQLTLPYGKPSDSADRDTVCGLGNRKNARFLELLENKGVEVFDDAVAALKRWRRGGMKLAIITASRNGQRILEEAGLLDAVNVVIDGAVAAEKDLAGKPEIMLEAARRLDVAPADAVIVEDATAGIRAGRDGEFGLVVGVSRNGNETELREAGADHVTADVYAVSFLRQIPNALDHMEDLSAWRGSRPLAVFLDFDGTLAEITEEPGKAQISAEARSALQRFSCPVAVISGRDREDLQSRVNVEGIYYAGNHGFDIAGNGHRHTLPEADNAVKDVDHAERMARERVGDLSGVIIERKRYSLAVHYRKVKSDEVLEKVQQAVEDMRQETGLRKRNGKKVLELEPAVDWNKGRALRWLIDILPVSGEESPFIVYAGDDVTDEDAFLALREDGPGIYVGDALTCSLADYHVRDPDEVLHLLRKLADALE